VLTCKVVCAQDYLVTPQNDTLRGKVKLLNFGTLPKVQLTTDEGKKNVYEVIQVKSFTIDNDIYHTIRSAQNYSFMKLMVPGYLSLYAYQPTGQNSWDGRYLVKRDGSSIEVPNLAFKKRMTAFLEDCPAISGKIEMGDLNRNDLEEILKEYNACIVSKTERHQENIQITQEKKEKINYWKTLEDALQSKPEFDGKSDAQDMIKEIKLKIQRSEKIPNFVIEGLKNALQNQDDLKKILQSALEQVN
jgi:hypothetical protein